MEKKKNETLPTKKPKVKLARGRPKSTQGWKKSSKEKEADGATKWQLMQKEKRKKEATANEDKMGSLNKKLEKFIAAATELQL